MASRSSLPSRAVDAPKLAKQTEANLPRRGGSFMRIEARFARAVLAAFAPPGTRGLSPHEGEVDYLRTAQQMLRGSTPLAAFGLRAALWMVALAPLWLWGRLRTVLEIDVASRTRLLAQLAGHRWFAVRELTMLLKLAAAMALLGTPSVRQRSGYDHVQPSAKVESGVRRKLPMLGEADVPDVPDVPDTEMDRVPRERAS